MQKPSNSLKNWMDQIGSLRARQACRIGLQRPYRRDRDLPRLIAVAPAGAGPKQTLQGLVIMRKLARALREERTRGRAGHWAYDLNRHLALKQALAAELQDWEKSCRGRRLDAARMTPRQTALPSWKPRVMQTRD